MEKEIPYIIAEIGSNWRKYPDYESCFDITLEQIYRAHVAGSDAVKFQIFTHLELYGYEDPEAELNDYVFPRSWVPRIKTYCDAVGIDFMCSAFSPEGYNFIDPFVDVHKIAAPEGNWEYLVDHVKSKGKDIIKSGKAYDIDAIDYDVFCIETVSNYPANPRDYEIVNSFMGLSDHTKGFDLIKEALNCDYRIFEVHVDLLFGEVKTPDACVSLNYFDFTEYVDRIRNPDKYYKEPKDYSRKEGKDGWFRPKL